MHVVALEGSNLSPGRSTLLGEASCMPVGSPRCSHLHVLGFFLKGGSWCSQWPLVTIVGNRRVCMTRLSRVGWCHHQL